MRIIARIILIPWLFYVFAYIFMAIAGAGLQGKDTGGVRPVAAAFLIAFGALSLGSFIGTFIKKTQALAGLALIISGLLLFSLITAVYPTEGSQGPLPSDFYPLLLMFALPPLLAGAIFFVPYCMSIVSQDKDN